MKTFWDGFEKRANVLDYKLLRRQFIAKKVPAALASRSRIGQSAVKQIAAKPAASLSQHAVAATAHVEPRRYVTIPDKVLSTPKPALK